MTCHEWDAAAYHRVSAPQYAWGLAVLERLAPRGDETVLDAGCGSGRLTAELRRRVPDGRVIALDLSRAMAALARETLEAAAGAPGAAGAAPALVVQADLAALPLRGAIDLAFSAATFHWVRDHDRLFRELRGALRPGGRLVAQCGGGDNLARVHALVRRAMRASDVAPHFAGWREPWHFAGEAETRRRLGRAGFADVRVALAPAPTPFPSRDALRAFLAAVVLRPHLARLTSAPALGARLLDEVTDALASEAPALVLDYRRLNIEAVAA